MGVMDGKVVLVFGVANRHSIAWAIAQRLHGEGAEVAYSYAGPKLERRVRKLVEPLGAKFVEPCDVTDDEAIDQLFAKVRDEYGRIDGLVHSIAFGPVEDLNGRFLDLSREGFRLTLDISAYSLIALARRAEDLMTDGGSIVAMSSYAAEKVIPRYNVMAVAKAALECEVRYLASELGPNSVRVNAISAGPMRTLASQAIDHFDVMLRWFAEITPLRRDMSQTDVANTALWLLSDDSGAVNGETLHVDGGYSALGIAVPESLKPPEVRGKI
jgi:enoyl-[acyl-carrier protein] reductase I